MIWYIVLAVALVLSVYLNINLWSLAHELKQEVQHHEDIVAWYDATFKNESVEYDGN